MAVKIGHASLDEHGKITGGAAGDQTGKEIRIQNWYNKGWNVLLRPIDPVMAEAMAQSMEAACRNDNAGYDQGGRNSGNARAKEVGYDLSKINTPCEFDCSSLMHAVAIAGGANLDYGSNGLTTRDMVDAFMATGQFERLTDSKYLTSDKFVKRGDVLVKEGSHTAMVLEDGPAVPKEPAEPMEYCSVYLPILKEGMANESVRMMQNMLLYNGYKLPNYGADREFGPETKEAVVKLQKDFDREADGVCGQVEWSALLGQYGVG